ncbi:MAG: aminoglycoside 3'-phosphotransferase [Actinomycetota bacterium]
MAKRPVESVEVPGAVAHLVGDEPAACVWRNDYGGLTFAVGDPPSFYLKWHPHAAAPEVDLADEAARMRWASAWIPVPEPFETGSDGDSSWLCTRVIDGTSAVDPRWQEDPAPAVAAIGHGLRRLHDAAPVEDCPYSWSTEERLTVARQRLATGALPADRPVGPEPQSTAAEAMEELTTTVPDPDPVVCHGDACAPNTLLDDDGAFLALVDVGLLGVGDRWADLAVATWSLAWNYGPGWERELFDAYGVDADPDLIRYYRLLWDVGP